MQGVLTARIAVLSVSLLCGCAGWTRLALPSDTTLAPRQQVQVWSGSHARVLHAVRLSGDSLVGVPFQKPPSCDSCRITIARSVHCINPPAFQIPGIRRACCREMQCCSWMSVQCGLQQQPDSVTRIRDGVRSFPVCIRHASGGIARV